MKRVLAVMLVSIMLVVIASLAFAQGKYNPVSVVEEWYLNKGYSVESFKDTEYDRRPVYFKDGTAGEYQTYQRVVKFSNSEKKSRPVAGQDYGVPNEKYGGWVIEESSGNTVMLTLYYVRREVKVIVTKKVPAEKQIPISLEKKIEVKKTEEIKKSGIETK